MLATRCRIDDPWAHLVACWLKRIRRRSCAVCFTSWRLLSSELLRTVLYMYLCSVVRAWAFLLVV